MHASCLPQVSKPDTESALRKFVFIPDGVFEFPQKLAAMVGTAPLQALADLGSLAAVTTVVTSVVTILQQWDLQRWERSVETKVLCFLAEV